MNCLSLTVYLFFIMKTHSVSRSIQFIIQFIYDAEYPSKKRLLQFLEEKDISISARTLERYIEVVRTDFGLEIVYSKTNNGYYIDKDKSLKVVSFFKFLEIAAIADVFKDSLKESKKIFEYVSFDDSKSFKGIENLKPILIALTQNRKLVFKHENFHNNTFKDYEITPFLLKEYINRWYVVGVPEGMEEIRTFGVDRLLELQLGKLTKLKKKIFQKQLESFEHIVGLHFNEGEPQNIRLLVDETHTKYMRSLPLHPSQVIHTPDKSGRCFVDFHLISNYEFETQILKIGDEVEVIYPENLRTKIINLLKNMLNKYS
jgi:predicted DNA-binding transcriptional regulator YafY